jgi:pantetheine-phosphate adenylyltransferase
MNSEARVAIYAGSFDPVTLGHEDVARRALTVADRLIIAVAHTASQQKRGMFSVPDRLEMIREVFADEPAIEAVAFEGLLVDYARRRGATLVIRGVRGVRDFEYELQMAQMNRALHPKLETVFLVPSPEWSHLSSSLVREITSLGGDVSQFVSRAVLERIASRREGSEG